MGSRPRRWALLIWILVGGRLQFKLYTSRLDVRYMCIRECVCVSECVCVLFSFLLLSSSSSSSFLSHRACVLLVCASCVSIVCARARVYVCAQCVRAARGVDEIVCVCAVYRFYIRYTHARRCIKRNLVSLKKMKHKRLFGFLPTLTIENRKVSRRAGSSHAQGQPA